VKARVVCAWCKKIVAEGIEPASHGICADCKVKVCKRQAEINRKQKPLNPRDVSILGGDPSL
jgi:hypothetical protein